MKYIGATIPKLLKSDFSLSIFSEDEILYSQNVDTFEFIKVNINFEDIKLIDEPFEVKKNELIFSFILVKNMSVSLFYGKQMFLAQKLIELITIENSWISTYTKCLIYKFCGKYLKLADLNYNLSEEYKSVGLNLKTKISDFLPLAEAVEYSKKLEDLNNQVKWELLLLSKYLYFDNGDFILKISNSKISRNNKFCSILDISNILQSDLINSTINNNLEKVLTKIFYASFESFSQISEDLRSPVQQKKLISLLMNNSTMNKTRNFSKKNRSLSLGNINSILSKKEL